MTPPAPTRYHASVLAALAERLATPAMDDEKPWEAQSLAHGAAGVALLHIERAHARQGTWATAHTWVRAATRHEISAAENTGLYVGAPAISFVLNTAETDGVRRYGPALASLDARLVEIAHRRLDTALARISHSRAAAFTEYDLFRGLTGIGRILLARAPVSDALGRILEYLVSLTTPLHCETASLPGWWVFHDPDPTLPTPGGHANFGLAHGIGGVLALLGTAMRREVTVEGQAEAIERVGAHLDAWRQDSETGPWWPQWITRDEIRTGRVRQPGPGRPSWCYGTPGIARAQQLAAIATGDTTRQHLAEHALAACLSDAGQLAAITDIGLCHGWAGLYQTVWRAAQDALTPAISHHLPHLATTLIHHTDTSDQHDPGVLTGAAGLALAAHTAARNTAPISGWDACLLIS